MIKVIKSKQDKFTRQCDKCACIYEYELEDIDNENNTTCPECNNKNFHYIVAKKAAAKKPTKKEI